LEPATTTDSDIGTVPIKIATWDIWDGRNARLETALRALNKMGMDLALLTETKLTDGIYTRYSSGYNVIAPNAVSGRQGGVALVYKDSPYWQVESVEVHDPNIISFEIVSGRRRYALVGLYIPPEDSTTMMKAQQVLNPLEDRRDLIVMGDLNVNLSSPEGARATEIALSLASFGLLDLHQHFRSGRMGGTPWQQQRGGRVVGSRPDYILSKDRKPFRGLWHSL